MGDMVRCINDLVAAGRLDPQDADRILGDYERATARFGLNGYPAAAAPRAGAAATLRSQRAGLAQRRRQRALQLIAQAETERLAASHQKGMAAGLQALIARDPRDPAGLVSLETRAGGLERLLMAEVADGLAKLRTTWFGLGQDRKLLSDVVRELHGQATGRAEARGAAQAFAGAAERARTLFNENGGAIAKREDWGWSHSHDPRMVARAGLATWIEDTLPLLDRAKMVGSDLMPLSDGELRLLLEETYRRISTDGLADITPGAAGRAKLANTRQDHRFLAFRDGDAWLKYHDKYGGGDLFANLTGHLQGMAHEIALLERFGPNPDATFRYVRDVALRGGHLTPGSIKDRMLTGTWNVAAGRVGTVNPALAETMTAVRNFIAATRLGSAVLSAVNDIAFVRQTLAWNGLPTSRFVRELVRQLMEMPAGERQVLAVRMGLGAEAWLTRGLAANRFAEVTGAGKTAKLADFTMRASGLSRWTDAELKAVGMTVMGELGDRAGTRFDLLHADLRKALERFGIDAQAWNEISAHGITEHAGAKYVDLDTLMGSALDEGRRLDLSRRLLDFTFELSQLAVPHPGVLERTITSAGLPRGTVTGELVRSVAQFKTFPLTIVMNHLRRGFVMQGADNKAKYLGGLIIGTTVMGALALQLKDISKGRDPRSMDDPNFWGSAFLQGGGGGIYGDFIYAGVFGESRFGRSMWEEISGPMLGITSDVVKLTAGNAGQALTGEDPHFVGEALRFAGQNVPFASSGWYTRLAFERLVTDQLRQAADPTSRRQMARSIRNRQAEYGQGFWWRPGAAAPSRGPDLEAVAGE